MRFDKTSREVVAFQPEDGIAHEEFNTHAHHQATDGRLYFGGLNGITAFYPNEVVPHENDAPFLVTQLYQFDSDKGQLLNKLSHYHDTQQIIMEPGDKFFTVEFSLLDYAEREHIYAWKIKGLDNDWTYQQNNSLRINALPYGNFILQIKAQGIGGNWAKQELNIPITVIKPFYLNWPFIVLFAGVTAIMILGFIKWRLHWLQTEKEKLETIVVRRTTELAEKNKELESLNRTKDRFFAIIAHDLRSPLTSLRGLAQKTVYLMKKNRLEDVIRLGNSVDAAVNNVHKLLDNLLSWALVQESKFPYRPEIIQANELVEEVHLLYKETAESKDVRLTIELHEPCQIFADRQAVATVLRNLVDNALKFTGQDGDVVISASQVNNSCLLIVADTGIGIPSEKIPHIFDHVSDQTTRGTLGEKGTGLGLFLCQELVNMNGGRIRVKSSLGKGTTFEIEWPSENCHAPDS